MLEINLDISKSLKFKIYHPEKITINTDITSPLPHLTHSIIFITTTSPSSKNLAQLVKVSKPLQLGKKK